MWLAFFHHESSYYYEPIGKISCPRKVPFRYQGRCSFSWKVWAIRQLKRINKCLLWIKRLWTLKSRLLSPDQHRRRPRWGIASSWWRFYRCLKLWNAADSRLWMWYRPSMHADVRRFSYKRDHFVSNVQELNTRASRRQKEEEKRSEERAET